MATIPSSGVGTISSAGVGSGIDVNSVVSQLMAIERRPIDQLEAKTKQLQTQLSSYGKLQGLLATLRDSAAKLTNAQTWGATTATSADGSIVTATTGNGSVPGHYAVTVTTLAAAQTLVSAPFADAAVTPGSGTLTIELGAWGAGQASFTPKAGATPVLVTVAAGSTLAQVRDQINAAGAGVVASIVSDANGARLALRSKDSGEANAFRITAADADGNSADASGLSAFAFDPSAGVGSMTQKQAAANAMASINGIDVESPSNTLADVIDGLTLTLRGQSATPVDIGVEQDKEALKKAIQAFADAWNELNKLAREQTAFNATSKSGGALQGDSTVVGLQRQLRTLLGGSSGASTVFTRLADIGFDVQRDGSISVVATKLDSALAKPDELRKLFANSDALVPANDGIAQVIKRYGDGALSVDGALKQRQQGLTDRIQRNDDREEQLEQRIAQIEKRLRAQYTALDAQMAQLNGLANYVTQQVAAFNRSTSTK